MELSVRPATVDDVAAIAEVHMTSWKESYTHLLSPGFFDSRTPERAVSRWVDTLAGPSAPPVHVATLDGTIVGFSGSGPSQDEAPVRDLQLYFIYVLAAHHGVGAGQRLLEAALGDAPASLWMVKDNPRALAFYRRNGFEPDGVEKLDVHWENLEEIRLVR
jgi:ribosomal protein S18 acetylase RimI-like enzyme